MRDKRGAFIHNALTQNGLPYIWGGQSPVVGFDCSGFVVWLLQSVGYVITDHTAKQLSYIFESTRVHGTPKAGCIAFYGFGGEVSHCMVVTRVWNNGAIAVTGARGGGSDTTTIDVAEEKRAYVGTYVNYWPQNLIMICDPWG